MELREWDQDDWDEDYSDYSYDDEEVPAEIMKRELQVEPMDFNNHTYPPFKKGKINERRFPDNMRYKSFEKNIRDEDHLEIKWITQGAFDVDDAKLFEQEVCRAVQQQMDEEGIDSFTILLEVESRDGPDYGYYENGIYLQ